jgi:hypothetical protein
MKSSLKTPPPSIASVAVPVVTRIEVAEVAAIGSKIPFLAHATDVSNFSFGDCEAISNDGDSKMEQRFDADENRRG